MDRKRFAVRIDCGEKCELLIENSSGLWESMVFDALDLPGELLSRGTAVMHCSFIIYNGEAILFSADSGVGKSTQAELWRVCRGARVINGDRAALRVKNGVLFACGLPYCGTSKISEAAEAPVGAIILLSQGRKNELRRADTANAFRELIGKLSYNTSLSESAEKAADLALAAAQQRVYYYSCRADESAVARLEEEICRNNSGR